MRHKSRFVFTPLVPAVAFMVAPASAGISDLSVRLFGKAGYESGAIEQFNITGGLELMPFSRTMYYESDFGDGVTGRTGASMDIDAWMTSDGGLSSVFELESLGSVGPIDGFPDKYPIADSASSARFTFTLDEAEQLNIEFGPVEGNTYSIDVFHNSVRIFEVYDRTFDEVQSYLVDLPAGEILVSVGSYTNSYSYAGTHQLHGSFTVTPTPSPVAVLGVAGLCAARRRR